MTKPYEDQPEKPPVKSHQKIIEIDFYFDFSSPYCYPCFFELLKLKQNKHIKLNYYAVLLGVIFKKIGTITPILNHYKSKYFKVDIIRSANYYGYKLRLPKLFPFSSVEATRLFYHIKKNYPLYLSRYISLMFETTFQSNKSIVALEDCLKIISKFDLPIEESIANDTNFKITPFDISNKAMNKGIFGTPFMIINHSNPYFGLDKIPEVKSLLEDI